MFVSYCIIFSWCSHVLKIWIVWVRWRVIYLNTQDHLGVQIWSKAVDNMSLSAPFSDFEQIHPKWRNSNFPGGSPGWSRDPQSHVCKSLWHMDDHCPEGTGSHFGGSGKLTVWPLSRIITFLKCQVHCHCPMMSKQEYAQLHLQTHVRY